MNNLHQTDFVIYDKANDHPVQFSDGSIVIYGNYEEAVADSSGNEIVIPCTELPRHWQDELIRQINN